MTGADTCCVYQQLRIDSPEPPPRPLAAIDTMFAAAVLPEDHPHALKFPERKPENDSTIVRSPSMTSKIRLQFRRGSMKNLKKDDEYDHDARKMTLQEVLDDTDADAEAGHRIFGSIPTEEKSDLKRDLAGAKDQTDEKLNRIDSMFHPHAPALPKSVSSPVSPLDAQFHTRPASSIYSRPVSANANAGDENHLGRNISPYWALDDLDMLSVDWPLRPSTFVDAPSTHVETTEPNCKDTAKLDKPVTSISTESQESSRSGSFVTSTSADETASVRFLALPRRPTPIPSKSSSSILTKASKGSRFLERFSPPKKAVRKRLSVFKFLRPGSRKQQTRSLSSPALNTTCTGWPSPCDGPSEEPGLLTVQYELTEQPNHVARSVSMAQLSSGNQDTLRSPSFSGALERRPTMADYERNLSVAGDDRRRPSAVNIERVKEVQEDDRRQSMGLRRRLSRARALKDDVNPLMAQALEKHQQEKALFCSASKLRESTKETEPTPVFSSSPFERTGTSLPPPSLADHNDLLDPLEKGQLQVHKRSTGTGNLLAPPPHDRGSSQFTSPAASTRVPSTRTSAEPILRPPPQGRKRIGTNLESWSRYPSHTRGERCGSAGIKDSVITRDFAVDINPNDIHDSEGTEGASPLKKPFGKESGQRSKSAVPTKRSATFGGIVRYYSNLFHTRGWHGQNRRTSVTIGGQLEYPELEMLPPPAADTTDSHKHANHLKHIEERLREDADKLKHYLQEGETKVEDYMKKEEGKLEEFVKVEERKLSDFVKTEEHKLEDFVRKEEGKLKEFVVEEEDKLMLAHYLDGPNDKARLGNNRVTSKAELWSELYRQCVARPLTGFSEEAGEAKVV